MRCISWENLRLALHQLLQNAGEGGQENEPNPMPRETSHVWTKILTDLWKSGMPLSRVADQLFVPEAELNNLLFGIASSITPPTGARHRLEPVN